MIDGDYDRDTIQPHAVRVDPGHAGAQQMNIIVGLKHGSIREHELLGVHIIKNQITETLIILFQVWAKGVLHCLHEWLAQTKDITNRFGERRFAALRATSQHQKVIAQRIHVILTHPRPQLVHDSILKRTLQMLQSCCRQCLPTL